MSLQANRFAADTGYTVALFGVGGLFTQLQGDQDETLTLTEVRTKDGAPPVDDDMRVAVLKYATGGVATQLTSRAEIIKFVSQRGVKALAEMHANQDQEQDEEASA